MRYRTHSIRPPPIMKLAESAKRFIGSANFLDLGQGLPGHIPPKEVLNALSERISHPTTHRYTHDQGQLELREELALYLRQTSQIDVDPQRELTITAGGNQAFAGTVLTIIEQDDEVIMPSPYYFNSVMAVQLAGGIVKQVPVNSRYQPDPEAIEAAITPQTKCVLLVSPNNPTGAVYDQSVVDKIVDICLQNDLFLISDEAYARLVFNDSKHYSPRRRRDAHDNIITLGSFSKDFGISGWRVGYTIGSTEFMDEFLKVQDTISICAPTAGQLIVLEALKSDQTWVEEELRRLSLLREFAYLRIREIDAFDTFETKGTFYLFPRVKECTSTRDIVLAILQSTETLVLPGGIFGEAGEDHLRISIGPLTPDAVDEAFNRLSDFFAHYKSE
ncbi:MAG: pyridoxal phosphate-dependent aminotransferase [Candidatus Thorarchaeota archaeon]|nr:pyridoxal phosphate-dependent aminotransferase [Candidatus Thorarchaeota archaeon]